MRLRLSSPPLSPPAYAFPRSLRSPGGRRSFSLAARSMVGPERPAVSAAPRILAPIRKKLGRDTPLSPLAPPSPWPSPSSGGRGDHTASAFQRRPHARILSDWGQEPRLSWNRRLTEGGSLSGSGKRGRRQGVAAGDEDPEGDSQVAQPGFIRIPPETACTTRPPGASERHPPGG